MLSGQRVEPATGVLQFASLGEGDPDGRGEIGRGHDRVDLGLAPPGELSAAEFRFVGEAHHLEALLERAERAFEFALGDGGAGARGFLRVLQGCNDGVERVGVSLGARLGRGVLIDRQAREQAFRERPRFVRFGGGGRGADLVHDLTEFLDDIHAGAW